VFDPTPIVFYGVELQVEFQQEKAGVSACRDVLLMERSARLLKPVVKLPCITMIAGS